MKRQAANVQILTGFALQSAKQGEMVSVVRRGLMTPDDLLFYAVINQLDAHYLQPVALNGDNLTHFYVVHHADGSADIYTEFGAIMEVNSDKTFVKGEPVFASDIKDIRSYRIDDLTLNTDDRVVCAMKVGWKYGLYFDFTGNIREDEIWQALGTLYRTLHFDRIAENIQERIRQSTKPHILTEGKTDWRHIEAARRLLQPHLSLGYPSTDDTLGDEALFQTCRNLAKFGPPYPNKVIAIFDRDNRDLLKKLASVGDLDDFQSWGNNVYSLVLPVPSHRIDYKNISIEMLYTDADIARTDESGKRLYFDNELELRRQPGAETVQIPIPPVVAMELDKKVFGDRVDQIVDQERNSKGLSKARFAELIYDQAQGFDSVDFSGFSPLFSVIDRILKIEP